MSEVSELRRDLLTTPTLGSRGKTIGRPRKQPPLDCALRIQKLAAEGRPKKGIASVLGVDQETLARWIEENPQLEEAFEAGREHERNELHQLLMRDARDGGKPNINAIFLLKSRHGYKENDPADAGNRINIVFNLPGPMSREEFMKTVVSADE